MISNRAIAGRCAALILFFMAVLAALARGGVSLTAQSLACAGAAFALGLALLGDRRAATSRRIRGRTPRLPFFAWVPLLVFAAAALQCLPIPSVLLKLIAPVNAQLRFFPPAPAASFAPITLDLPATASQLAPLFAVVAALFAASLLARRPRTQLLLMAAPIAAALVQVGICFVRLAGQGALAGTFVNRNHLAALLVLGALISLGAALSPPREEEPGTLPQLATTRPLWIAAAAACAACALLTLSRGAALGLGCGAFCLALLEQRSPDLSRRRSTRISRMLWIAIPLAFALTGAFLLSNSPLTSRFADLSRQPISADTKLRSFIGAAKVALEHPLFGVGRGAWRYLAERHRSVPGDIAFIYVENEPLQLAAEEGIPLALLIVAIAIIAWRRAAKLARSGLSRGVLAGTFALALQNLVDFNLELLGVSLPLAIALGAALADESPPAFREGPELYSPARPPDLSLHKGLRIPQPLIFFAALLGIFLAPIPILLAPISAERESARLAYEARNPATSADELLADAAQTVARHPADWLVSLAPAIGLQERSPRRTAEALAWVGRSQMLGPKSWRPHYLAAQIFLRAGRRDQARVESRLALENLGDIPYGDPLELPGQTCATLDELLEATPDDPLQRAQVAGHLRMHKHPELSRALVEHELVLPAETRSPAAAEALAYELAYALLDAQDFAGVERVAAQLPETNCSRALLISQARSALHRSPAEIESPLLAAPPECMGKAPIYETLFRGRIARHDLKAAGELLDEPALAATNLPFAPDVHLWRAQLLEEKQLPAQALHERWLAALIAPDRIGYALDYAERLRSQGDLPGAILALRTLSLRATGDARVQLDARLAAMEDERAHQQKSAPHLLPPALPR